MSGASKIVDAGCYGLVAGAALTLMSCTLAHAQMGPVDTRGYLEYRFSHIAGKDVDSVSSHGAAVRTDVSTYFWRPWILTANGSLLFSQYNSTGNDGLAKSSIVQGGLWLNAFPRSNFPLTVFYEDFDADYDSRPYRRFGRTKSYGIRQQLSSDHYGDYALEWRRGLTNALYADGFSVPTRNENDKLEFGGRKAFGRNNFSLRSSKLVVDAEAPEQHTDSLRHTLRHTFNAGSRFDLQNTFFVTDETIDSEFFNSDRLYKQLYSIATWRPNTERRMLVTGRGLFQESESGGQFGGSTSSNMALSGTASYQLSDRVSMTGALGFATMESDMGGDGEASYQQLGMSYVSLGKPLWGGNYHYNGRTTIGNRSEFNTWMSDDIQELKFDVGHTFGRSFESRGGKRIDVRALQRVTTTHDTLGREINILRSSVYMTSGKQTGQVARYLRFSLTDQHTFGDEGRAFQLVDTQYSLQGNVTRDSSWDLNATVQYGRRTQDKPLSFSNESSSLSYSIAAAYRHNNLFDVPLLDFSSDFRFQSEDFESDDPFDEDFDIDRQRLNTSWRNRLDYRIGMLQLQSDLDLNEVDGKWLASFRLNVRRFFGMR